MPLAILAIGIILLIAAIQGTLTQLGTQIEKDKGFIPWAASIIIIGALGYAPGFKDISRALLVLVIIVILLAHEGFIGKLQQSVGING